MKHNGMKRLPDTELEVMKALWDSGPETPRAELERRLASFGWAANTINTYLTRLADKGFVSVLRSGKSNRYTPLVSREEYNEWATGDLIRRLYRGSAKNLVAALIHSDSLSQADVEELRKSFHVEGAEDA